MEFNFESIYCKGKILFKSDYDIIINGEINDEITYPYIDYYAPSPPDLMTSFSGSGLPYIHYEQAFYNTPNKGTVEVKDTNKFSIYLYRPNSYYKDFNTLSFPYVKIIYNKNKNVIIDLPYNKIPYRSLQYPLLRKKEKELFYHRKLPIRTQEQILRDSGYDGKHEHKNFWGLKPPM